MGDYHIESAPQIPTNRKSKVVLAISMEGIFLKKEALRDLIEFYRRYNPTILIADTLQKYNTSYEQAQQKGDEFLQDNGSIFSGLTVIRWDQWIFEQKQAFDKARTEKIEAQSSPGSHLHNKCIRTAKMKGYKTPERIKKSVEYQKEEYAVILILAQQFDFLVYPKKASPGISCLYEVFPKEMSKLCYVHATLTPSKKVSQFKQDLESKQLPIALKLVILQMEHALTSGEIPEASKVAFILAAHELLVVNSPPDTIRAIGVGSTSHSHGELSESERISKLLGRYSVFRTVRNTPSTSDDDKPVSAKGNESSYWTNCLSRCVIL